MSNSQKQFKPPSAVYTPAQVSTYGVEAIEAMRKAKTRLLGLGIAGVNDYFAPMMPGQVCAVIAQTSQYKSGFMHCVEHNAARQLQVDGRTAEILVHVSVEECIEEQAYLEFARRRPKMRDAWPEVKSKTGTDSCKRPSASGEFPYIELAIVWRAPTICPTYILVT